MLRLNVICVWWMPAGRAHAGGLKQGMRSSEIRKPCLESKPGVHVCVVLDVVLRLHKVTVDEHEPVAAFREEVLRKRHASHSELPPNPLYIGEPTSTRMRTIDADDVTPFRRFDEKIEAGRAPQVKAFLSWDQPKSMTQGCHDLGRN
jgi:hypothetical protein